MKPATGIGIGLAVFGILMGAMMGGTSPAAFIDIPAFLIIFLGTTGVTMASVGMDAMKNIPNLYKLVVGPPELNVQERVELLVSLAEQARREGLLALDSRVNEVEDAYTRKGLQLVVDGIDPDLVADVMQAEIDAMAARHHVGASMFEKAGGFAPTMGIVGTVMGLVHVLQNLSSPSSLGPAISSAFIATLLGIGSANVVYLPVSNRLKALSTEEIELRRMTLDGILAVQAGDNPRVVSEKLSSYIPPELRETNDDNNVEAIGGNRADQAEAA